MKKFNFFTVTLLSIQYFFIIMLFGSCQKDVSTTGKPEYSEINSISRSSTSTGLSIIYLKVTISDVDANGNHYNIKSDGLGDYIDGQTGVGAKIDQYGNFIFDVATVSRKGIPQRNLNFDLTQPVQQYLTPPSTQSQDYHMASTNTYYITFIPLQNMSVGQSECIGFGGGGTSNNFADWKFSFHRNAEDTPTSPTAYAVFKRLSATQWTVTPVGSCSGNSNIASIRSGDGSTLYGYYNLPFFFTLTAL